MYTSNTIWHQVNAVTTAIVLPKGLSGSDNWKVGVLARAHTRRGTGPPVSAKEDHWICSDWLWLVVRDRAGVKYNTVTKVGKYARSDQCKHQNLVFHAADWTLDLGLVSCIQIPLTVKTQPLDSSPSWRHFLFPISVVQSVSRSVPKLLQYTICHEMLKRCQPRLSATSVGCRLPNVFKRGFIF